MQMLVATDREVLVIDAECGRSAPALGIGERVDRYEHTVSTRLAATADRSLGAHLAHGKVHAAPRIARTGSRSLQLSDRRILRMARQGLLSERPIPRPQPQARR